MASTSDVGCGTPNLTPTARGPASCVALDTRKYRAFGGDGTMVTIWGESAGANSVGTQLIAYGGRDDGLFLQRSARVVPRTPADWQPYYDAIVKAAGCSSAAGALSSLREVPINTLYDIFEDASIVTLSGLEGPQFSFNKASSSKFPTSSAEMQTKEVISKWGHDNATTDILAALYPDIPEIGIPATMTCAPQAGYGAMDKRVVAFQGDVNIHAARRLASRIWRTYNVPAYSYLFDVINNGAGPDLGANHGSEIAYVFNNVDGVGYDENANPMLGKPKSYTQLSMMMSRMWVRFVTTLNPNLPKGESHWPKYELDNPEIIVFDANVTALCYVKPDLYRAQGIKYISDNLASLFGH